MHKHTCIKKGKTIYNLLHLNIRAVVGKLIDCSFENKKPGNSFSFPSLHLPFAMPCVRHSAGLFHHDWRHF